MSVYIVRRMTNGREATEDRPAKTPEARYVVRMQTRRASAQVHLGSFKVRRLAEARKAWAEAELAVGRIPDPRRIGQTDGEGTVRQVAESFLASRIDAAELSRLAFKSRADHIVERFGGYRADSLTRAEIQQWVVDLSEKFKPRTVQAIVLTLGQILDHAGIDPNPARGRQIRKPRISREARELPTKDEVARLLESLPERYARPVRLMETTGLRIGSVVTLCWKDVDAARRRLFVDDKTSSGRRFVVSLDNPIGNFDWLFELAAADDARVFPGLTRGALGEILRSRCRTLGIEPHVHPHVLRHLHASRLLHHGVMSPADVAVRIGHSSAHITWQKYAHVVAPD